MSAKSRAAAIMTQNSWYAGSIVGMVGLIGVIDCLGVLFNSKKRAIHDFIADTKVIRIIRSPAHQEAIAP